jgi:hypothetical protein
MAELLKKIPAHKCWEITAKILTRFTMLRGSKTTAPLLGEGEGIISPVMGYEKYNEIQAKIMGREAHKVFPMVKERFSIPVDDVIGAIKLYIVAVTLMGGPEYKFEIIDANPNRVVVRRTKCPWRERYNERQIDPGLWVCPAGHQAWCEEGLRAVNPKLAYKLVKTLTWGDQYCEAIIEFKDV